MRQNTIYKFLLKITLFTFFIIFLSITVPSISAKDEYKKTLERVITLENSEWVQVTENHNISWSGRSTYFPKAKNFDYFYIYPPYADQKVLENETVKDIVVTGGGGSIAFTKTVQNTGLELKTQYYKDLSVSSSLQFSLQYKSKVLMKKQGGVIEIAHSSLSKDFKTRQLASAGNYDEVYEITYKFIIPNALGTASSISPEPKSITNENNQAVITFTADQLVGKPIRIIVGNQRYLRFELTADISKTNSSVHQLFQQFVNNEIEVALPNDIANIGQKVFYESISPKPRSFRIDDNGNLIAKIPVSAAESSKLTIIGYASITKQNFDEAGFTTQLKKDIPIDFAKYTISALPEWPVDSKQFTEIASKTTDSSGNISQIIKNSLSFVTDTLTYKDFSSPSELRRLGAQAALEARTGVCMEYSDLLLTVLRAEGIPTRTIYGDGVGSFVDQSIKGIGHQWIESWIPTVGWVPIDPTWSDQGSQVIGPDLDHFIWYKATASPHNPPGFSCNTWDESKPCQEFMLINTEPVDSIPKDESLETIQQLFKDQDNQKSWLGTVLSDVGASYLGRIAFSATTMNIFLAVIIYIFSYIVIRMLYKMIKKVRSKMPVKDKEIQRD